MKKWTSWTACIIQEKRELSLFFNHPCFQPSILRRDLTPTCRSTRNPAYTLLRVLTRGEDRTQINNSGLQPNLLNYIRPIQTPAGTQTAPTQDLDRALFSSFTRKQVSKRSFSMPASVGISRRVHVEVFIIEPSVYIRFMHGLMNIIDNLLNSCCSMDSTG